MAATLARDIAIADALRLRLRMEPDRRYRVLSRNFWRGTWGIERRTRARVETIRSLLHERGIDVQIANGMTLGDEPPNTWMTVTLRGVPPWPTPEWFHEMAHHSLRSEASITNSFVQKLLLQLDYPASDLDLELTTWVQVGGKRKHGYADVVAFDGLERARPLLVVEVKKPAKPPAPAFTTGDEDQARSYAFSLQTPAWVLTNAKETRVYVWEGHSSGRLVNTFHRETLATDWPEMVRVLSRESMLICAGRKGRGTA